jgi:hypothetical protein
MELTAVRLKNSILRAELVKIVLWLDAVAQLVACSSFCYEYLMWSSFFKAWMESALILIEFSAVECCSVPAYLFVW